jgi:hypothetical protein
MVAALGLVLVIAGCGDSHVDLGEPVERPPAEELDKAQARITVYLKESVAAQATDVRPMPAPVPILDEPVLRAFPGHLFFVLKFGEWPVAFAPRGLSTRNLFAVDKNGALQHFGAQGVGTLGKLEAFFIAALVPCNDTKSTKNAAWAWLRLAQELETDSSVTLSVSDRSLRVSYEGGAKTVSGKTLVKTTQSGDQGDLTASLTFDPAGKLTQVVTKNNVQLGMRPICTCGCADSEAMIRHLREEGDPSALSRIETALAEIAARERRGELTAQMSAHRQRLLDVKRQIQVERLTP